ncbi:TetR/AcrR family transcriptional regulator [Accumulibacter sp.]|uniref:TetR/AcrR family transcriptional regulator n=1 Tax=Accumulibacter sp. TaxID=2053492 RepID=UPI0028C43F62|nr:TetR/AcrR family transcriptional regulator [Accumulibacter sp.]
MSKSIPRPPSSATLGTEQAPDGGARALRADAMAQLRRGLILDAARAAFFELGLEGASLREIARRAGYTPGAIYSYFASKEEIYAALLGESLLRLNAHVAEAPVAGSAVDRVNSKAGAFFDFYSDNPRDLDLGFYLFQGVRPLGLTRELDAQLNARLRATLQPTADALAEFGLDAAATEIEVTALFAHMVGLLVLIHTGRIRIFRQQAPQLLQRYLDQLTDRLQGR